MNKALWVLIPILSLFSIIGTTHAHTLPTVTRDITITPEEKLVKIQINYFFDPIIAPYYITEFDINNNGLFEPQEKEDWKKARLSNIEILLNYQKMPVVEKDSVLPSLDDIVNLGKPIILKFSIESSSLDCNSPHLIKISDNNVFTDGIHEAFRFNTNPTSCYQATVYKNETSAEYNLTKTSSSPSPKIQIEKKEESPRWSINEFLQNNSMGIGGAVIIAAFLIGVVTKAKKTNKP